MDGSVVWVAGRAHNSISAQKEGDAGCEGHRGGHAYGYLAARPYASRHCEVLGEDLGEVDMRASAFWPSRDQALFGDPPWNTDMESAVVKMIWEVVVVGVDCSHD